MSAHCCSFRSVSLAFNLAPIAPNSALLRRGSIQATSGRDFPRLIAGTPLPLLLALLNDTPTGTLMLIGIWSAALLGIALKLIVPQHFGRLTPCCSTSGIGWSGVLIFQSLASVLHRRALCC